MVSEPTRMIPFLLFSLITVPFIASQAHALDQGYIDAVEADVAEFTSHEFHPPANSSWLGGKDNDSTQRADQQGFSEFLQSNSPGSYIFYKKLPSNYRMKLHKDYLATGDLDRIKKDIFEYTREMKK
jgi:hypothetical protein